MLSHRFKTSKTLRMEELRFEFRTDSRAQTHNDYVISISLIFCPIFLPQCLSLFCPKFMHFSQQNFVENLL